jgi:DMSO/TMAO reductase YedYZ molybdopterin-dependent catalytic subunit
MKYTSSVSLLLLASSIACAQPSSDTLVILTVTGDVSSPLHLRLADLQKLPRRVVHAQDRDQDEHDFEGVELYRILQLAGVQFGDSVKGKKHASSFLVAQGSDDFRALFALVELDPSFTDRLVILAYSRDGTPLPTNDGPLRIVVPDEKRRARWVRQVRSFVVQHVQ